MDAATRKKIKGRVLTVMSKIDELKQTTRENDDISDALTGCNFEGWGQDLMSAYVECDT